MWYNKRNGINKRGFHMIYLTAKGISKTHSAKMLLDQVDFSIDSGDKIGVIGINGTGQV